MKLPDDIKRNLILSVGTHRPNRPYSPLEVAEKMQSVINQGVSAEELRKMLHLDGSSMVARFLGLLNLEPDIRYLVDWGKKDQLLSMTAAVEIARLPPGDQVLVANKALEYGFSKEEIKQVVQLRQRSREDINSCLTKVLALRPNIERRFVFVGAITDSVLMSSFGAMTQLERDSILRKIVNTRIPQIKKVSTRTSRNRFYLIGDEELSNAMKSLQPDFETIFNQWLNEELRNESLASR